MEEKREMTIFTYIAINIEREREREMGRVWKRTTGSILI